MHEQFFLSPACHHKIYSWLHKTVWEKLLREYLPKYYKANMMFVLLNSKLRSTSTHYKPSLFPTKSNLLLSFHIVRKLKSSAFSQGILFDLLLVKKSLQIAMFEHCKM